jgi:hypothetical protein
VGTLIAFREIAAETPSIVRYCQNTIGYSLWSLTSRFRIARRSPSFLFLPGGEALGLCAANDATSPEGWDHNLGECLTVERSGAAEIQGGSTLNNQLSTLFCTDSSTPPTLGNEREYLNFLSHLDTNKLPPSANFPDSKAMPRRN